MLKKYPDPFWASLGVKKKYPDPFMGTWVGVVLVLLLVGGCGAPVPTAQDVALNDRGVAQMGRYEFSAATATFAEVTERAPDWQDARVNLAIATLNRQEEGDERAALMLLEGVIKADPTHLRAIYTAGIIRLYIGEADAAVRLLQQVIAADPADAYAAYFLGQSWLQSGDYQAASTWFEKALQLDPYLRSAYWAGAQSLRRSGRADDAAALLADYQRFDANPAARTAGFSYKKMGPKAEALSVAGASPPAAAAMPAGDLFAAPGLIRSGAYDSVTTVDANGDGAQDLFLLDAEGVVATLLLGSADGNFTEAAATGITPLPHTSAALWGDIDDDGQVDLVLCAEAGVALWRGVGEARFEPWVRASKWCRDGALIDADHDGDLDLFITGPDGNELMINNRDGTFRNVAAEMGLVGTLSGRQVLVADLDSDRDLDIVVIGDSLPNEVWQNDRTWQYQSFPGLDDFKGQPLAAVSTGDVDADGYGEIYGVTPEGEIIAWAFTGNLWQRQVLRPARGTVSSRRQLTLVDFNGDGRPELLAIDPSGFQLLDAATGKDRLVQEVTDLRSAIPVLLQPVAGPDLVLIDAAGARHLPAGNGRQPFLALSPTGRNESDQMRTNGSGIGTRISVRSGGRWSIVDTVDPHSGPGQSLAPVSIGLAGHPAADYIALLWSDGVSQTEIGLPPGLHRITETQRQLASCPVVFVWDGERYRFVTDVLGVGGIGFFAAPGVYAPPRPFERLLLDQGLLVAKDGHYQIKLTEPMEENAYLDHLRLDVYDLPPGWSMVLDERMDIAGPPATGRPITFRETIRPNRVLTKGGADVTPLIASRDLQAAPPGAVDPRFIGLLRERQELTLEFDHDLTGDGLVLVADGWIEYPYSQTVFGAWQAGLRYEPTTLSARDAAGAWQTVIADFGYPAGMPRTMALPLLQLPPGTRALRLSSNMEVYWDQLRLVREETLEGLVPLAITPAMARVARMGFPLRTTGPQRVPAYDYGQRSAYWDTKFQRGFYTAFGDATDLVTAADGAVAIIGGGEEIHLEFPALTDAGATGNRFFVLDFRGWAKDMDLYTEDGDTVGPLPVPDDMDAPQQARREALHDRYNVRFEAGM